MTAHKYIDCKLNFADNVDAVCEKANQKLFLIEKLNGFGVNCNILERTYVSLIESGLTYNSSVWYGHLTLLKNRLSRVVGKEILYEELTSHWAVYTGYS